MRRRQCKACPWRKDVKPDRDIPNGYDAELHRRLEDTIVAGPKTLNGPIRMMACHESAIGAEVACVGWLANQLNEGNNLGLRLRQIRGELPEFETIGEQHESFAATLGEST